MKDRKIMNCQKCTSERVKSISAKCNDLFAVDNSLGFTPADLCLGTNDYVKFTLCLNCGQLQGSFPTPIAPFEKDVSDVEIAEFFGTHFKTNSVVGRLHHKLVPEIIAEAKSMSSQFGVFVENVIEYGCSESGIGNLFPKVQDFIQMYRDNNYYLEY